MESPPRRGGAGSPDTGGVRAAVFAGGADGVLEGRGGNGSGQPDARTLRPDEPVHVSVPRAGDGDDWEDQS